MSESRIILSQTVVAALVILVAAPVAAAAEIEGRWDLTFGNPPHMLPSWLEVQLCDGRYVGRFVGAVGSVWDVEEIRFENSKIGFQAHNYKWTGMLKGDTLSGTRVNDQGDKAQWVGERFLSKIDLTGQWRLKAVGLTTKYPLCLELDHRTEQITGKLTEYYGGRPDRPARARTVNIKDARLNEGRFTFSTAEMTTTRTYSAHVKGDVLEGHVIDDGKRHEFTGYRQRQWGEPIELFNGKNLDGWKPLTNRWKPLGEPGHFRWKVVDGVMTTPGGHDSCNIITERVFYNFKLHVEFKVPKGGNSGIYLRGRYEIQVYDNDAPIRGPWFTPANVCGSLYNRIPPNVNAAKKHDEWQTFDVKLTGSYLTIVHNGLIVIDNEEVEGITGGAIDSKEGEPGPIYLQGDHTPIYYRKITLTPAEPPSMQMVHPY